MIENSFANKWSGMTLRLITRAYLIIFHAHGLLEAFERANLARKLHIFCAAASLRHDLPSVKENGRSGLSFGVATISILTYLS